MARGNLYEISIDRDELGNMDESYFYNCLSAINADYVQNKEGEEKEEATAQFVEMMEKYGAETGSGDEKTVYFYVNDSVRQNYFRRRYDELKDKVQKLEFSSFISNRFEIWDIKHLLHDTYGDAVYYNDTYMTVDTFLRAYAKDGERYYIGNVVFMH